MNRKFLKSKQHNLYKNQYLFLIWKFFDRQLRPKQSRQTNLISQASCLFVRAFCSTLLILSNTLSRNVNFFGFPQTTCNHFRGTCSRDRFSQTSGIIHLFKNFIFTVGFQDEKEWLTATAVFLFMLSLVFFGCSSLLWSYLYMVEIVPKHF